MTEKPDIVRSVIQELEEPEGLDWGIRIFIKREDLIHDSISGNKWRKLKYNLEEAGKLGYKKLLTFGGAYSNHIHAVAAAGRIFGFETVGVIRGEPYPGINDTLRSANSNGMKLYYLDRRRYGHKYDPENLGLLAKEFGDFYLIPEGGSNSMAIKDAWK